MRRRWKFILVFELVWFVLGLVARYLLPTWGILDSTGEVIAFAFVAALVLGGLVVLAAAGGSKVDR